MKLLSILLFCFVISGCASISVANLQRTSDKEVQVFSTKLPEKDFTEIKYIQVDGSIFHRPERLMKKLAEHAKKEGADAVISVKFGYAVYLPFVSGIAVKYK